MKKRLNDWADSRRPESGGFVGVTDEGESEIDLQTFLLFLPPAAFGMLFYTKFGPIFGLGAAILLVLIEFVIFRTLNYIVQSAQ